MSDKCLDEFELHRERLNKAGYPGIKSIQGRNFGRDTVMELNI